VLLSPVVFVGLGFFMPSIASFRFRSLNHLLLGLGGLHGLRMFRFVRASGFMAK
jgi:hypothetical protein